MAGIKSWFVKGGEETGVKAVAAEPEAKEMQASAPAKNYRNRSGRAGSSESVSSGGSVDEDIIVSLKEAIEKGGAVEIAK
jgi:hypothetical protein